MSVRVTIEYIQQSLELTNFDGFKAQMGMSPVGRERMLPKTNNPPRQSAVLVLIYPKYDTGLNILLTKRTATLRGHSGQVSFPGGSVDDTDISLEHTALRETCEEVGICDETDIRILGRLTKLWIPPSNFDVYPIVAAMHSTPHVTPSPDEVADILHMPLSDLLDDATKKMTQMTFQNVSFDVPYYEVNQQIVWGATAGMLSELELRLKTVLEQG